MKKLGLLVIPLMTVSLLASCGGKKTTWAVKMKVTASDNEVISFDCGIKDTFTVNWGDGTTNSEKSHTYAAGTYDIKINNQLETFTYTSENRDSILELEINDLLSTDRDAFEDCSKLSVVSFTNNTTLQIIERDTFKECFSLTSITIPSSVTQIKQSAFGSTGLQTVDFEKGSKLEIIGAKVFSGCKDLSTIKIPSSIKRIYQYAFNSCDSLIYNTKDKINYLGNDENPYLVAMKTTDEKQSSTYTLDESCRVIYSEIFYRSQTLSSITIPNNVISIIEDAFANCANLKTVNFYDDSILEFIDENAFGGCSGLTHIDIPNSVTYIEKKAFSGCYSLIDFSIPNNIEFIGNNAFSGCDLSSLYNTKDKINYLGNDENPYLVAMETTDEKQSSTYTLDESCRVIYSEIFNSCENLISLIIPNKVASIGYCSFYECTALVSIALPASVTKLDNRAFQNCSQLSIVDLTALKTIPAIHENSDIFNECSNSLKLYVTHDMIDYFKADRGWNEYADKITDEPVPSL